LVPGSESGVHKLMPGGDSESVYVPFNICVFCILTIVCPSFLSHSITTMGNKRVVRILLIMDSVEFEHELAMNLETLDTDKHVGFHTGLQTGSFPSAGKPLTVTSHTSPTSSICTVHNSEVNCF